MDKNEYNLKLQEIDQYVDRDNFEEAAKVADSIEWKRVRNVRTLCMVSEIYEAVDRYEDSKELLLKAYRRSPLGRAILYRLVEVTIQLKQFDEAIEYYSEYVQAAPHDNNRFILKYKIYRGRGSSVDEQIDILKEYLDQEYSEKYAYELAKLYQQADRIPEMLAACDDLVLWFHSGKYVIKALELKRKYAQLTPKQQQIYDHRFDAENVEDFDILPGHEHLSPQTPAAQAADPNLAETIAEDTQKSIAAEVAAAAAEAEAADAAVKAEASAEKVAESEAAEVAAEPAEEISEAAAVAEDNAEKTRVLGKDMLAQAAAAARALQAEASVAKTQILGKELFAQAETEESAAEERAESDGAEKLAEETADASVDAASDATEAAVDVAEETVTETAEAAEEVAEDTKAVAEAEAAEVAETAAASAEAIGDADETAAEAAAEAEPATVVSEVQAPKYNTQELQTEVIKNMRQIVSGIGRTDDIDADQAAMDELIDQSKQDQVDAVAAKENQVRLQKSLNLPKVPQTRATAPQLSIDDILLSMGERGEAVREAAAKAVKPTRPAPAGVLSAVDEALLNLGIQPEKPATEEVKEETAPEMTETTEPVNEEVTPAAETAETELKEDMSRELAEAFAEEPEQTPAEAPSEEDILTAKTRVIPTDEIAERYEKESMQKLQEEFAQVMSEADEAEQIEEASETAEAAAEMPAVEEVPEADSDEVAEEDFLDEEDEEAAEQIEASAAREVRQIEEPDVEDNMAYAPKADTTGMSLRPEVRDRFLEFLDIEGLEGQIENALEQALAKGKDRTSRTGNVLIFGGHGCGKTTIAKALARSLAQIRGIKTLKMAQIYATDLNRKDIAATISKIAGGVLIVEEAGDLEDKVVDQLTTAMEFRTDGLILILEDEQKYIHDLLMRHPRFTMKFTSQINIPNFTPDELVSFADHYAETKSCVLSDSAADMLGAKLAEQMDQGTAVSLTNVIEQVDKAIHKANTFGRKLLAGKKRYDEMNRVILIDKDFK